MRVLIIAAVVGGALLLTGCPKKPTTPPESTTGTEVQQPAAAETSSAAGSAGVGQARNLPGQTGAGAAGSVADVAAGRIVYFDYDSSEIRPEFTALIAAQAARLAGHANLRVRLEGHTDERGSREYNIALGERRAQAVRRALLLQGVTDAQVTTVSYGEERPAVEGSDEAAYQKNRRVEFFDAG